MRIIRGKGWLSQGELETGLLRLVRETRVRDLGEWDEIWMPDNARQPETEPWSICVVESVSPVHSIGMLSLNLTNGESLLCKAEDTVMRSVVLDEIIASTDPACDCGAMKANTTHSDWCSLIKGKNQWPR